MDSYGLERYGLCSYGLCRYVVMAYVVVAERASYRKVRQNRVPRSSFTITEVSPPLPPPPAPLLAAAASSMALWPALYGVHPLLAPPSSYSQRALPSTRSKAEEPIRGAGPRPAGGTGMCSSFGKAAEIASKFSRLLMTANRTTPNSCSNSPRGHNYIGHNYIGHNCIRHNYIGHNYVGHTYTGQKLDRP